MHITQKLEISAGPRQVPLFEVPVDPAPKKTADTGYFTPAQALDHLAPKLLDEIESRAWILEQLHGYPPIVACPDCRFIVTRTRQVMAFTHGLYVTCPECGRKFSATTGTFIAGTHQDFRTIFLLAVLLATGLDNNQISKVLGVTAETVRLWRHRFSSLAEIKQINRLAPGRLKIDDEGEGIN